MTFDLGPTDLTINRDHLLIKDYLPTKFWNFWGKALLSYQLHKVWETDMTFDLDLWPTDLTINRDRLLTKDYLPTKFEASGAKRSGVISCTRLRATDIPTYRPTSGNKVKKLVLAWRSKWRPQGQWPWCHLKGYYLYFCMQNMNNLSLTVQKLYPKVKVDNI